MVKKKENEIAQFCPASREEWRDWLEENHQKETSVWVIFYKKSAKKPTMTWSEAVDEALCFGWIDSKKLTIDDEKYQQFFSVRKSNSMWSKVNKDKIDVLTREGKMRQAGLTSVKLAQENGTWSMMDDVEALIIPPDLEDAFANFEGAKDCFLGFSKSIKKIILHWIITAKRPETRQKRISETASSAGQNLRPNGF